MRTMIHEPIKGFDGAQIAPQVFVIGDINWNEETQQWRCLANYYGSLALIEVKPRSALPTGASS